MIRTGYDADVEQYWFRDTTTGVQYCSAPGEAYGTLLPTATANYPKLTRGGGRRCTCKYPSIFRVNRTLTPYKQYKRMIVRCYSPRISPLAQSRTAHRALDPALPPEATTAPRLLLCRRIPATDMDVASPLRTFFLRTSSALRRLSLRRRPVGRRRQRLARRQSHRPLLT